MGSLKYEEIVEKLCEKVTDQINYLLFDLFFLNLRSFFKEKDTNKFRMPSHYHGS